ncbi:THAP domain [Popillia japonica]|uniref:THAP domain n=1 Tax=Popillia japonica TaxID=7064 RepID=A0AAW1LFL9_POPJA
MPSIKCCVPNCNTRYRKDSKDNHFFQLPADEAIRNKWIAQIGGQGVLHPKAKVCDKHFDLQNMYWNRIEKDAIPTLYLPDPSITTSENPDGAMEITVDVMQPSTSKDFHTANTCVQTTQILSANSPRKARLKSEIKSLQKKVTLLENKADAVSNEQLSISDEQFLKFCEDHFNKSTANLFKIQLQLVKRGPHGYRYSNEFKQFALNIFFLGPKVYRFLASAMATAEFVSKMDNLFDVLNSQSFNSNKILNRPFTGTDKQMKVLYEMLKVFSELKVFNHDNVDITKTLNFINGWKITIKSILELWKIVSSKGVNHMRTRRLNQDALENFFGTFSRAFKKLFCLNYFQFADNSNCIEDLHNVLINLQPNEIKRLDILFPPDTIFQKALSIDSNDYQNFHLPEANALTYFKSYAKDTFGNLIMPGQDFLQYIKSLEEKFCKIFPELSVTPRVGLLIKEQLLSVPYTSPCPDFPKDYLLNFKICK